MADCSRSGFQPPEMHNRQQWTAVYIVSLAVRSTVIAYEDYNKLL